MKKQNICIMGFDWNAGCSGFGSGDYKTRASWRNRKMFRLRNVRRCGVPKVPNMVIRSVCVIWV